MCTNTVESKTEDQGESTEDVFYDEVNNNPREKWDCFEF